MKRFLCFEIPFSIIFGIAVAIHPVVGGCVAGGGFTAAYLFGENFV